MVYSRLSANVYTLNDILKLGDNEFKSSLIRGDIIQIHDTNCPIAPNLILDMVLIWSGRSYEILTTNSDAIIRIPERYVISPIEFNVRYWSSVIPTVLYWPCDTYRLEASANVYYDERLCLMVSSFSANGETEYIYCKNIIIDIDYSLTTFAIELLNSSRPFEIMSENDKTIWGVTGTNISKYTL